VKLTSNYIKPSSNTNDIKVLMCPILELDASLVEADDSVVLDIDDVDVGSVELFEIGVFEARPLDAPVMRHLEWCEDVLVSVTVDAGALLLGPEVVGFLVCFFVEEVVPILE